jgi:hypothetical protein
MSIVFGTVLSQGSLNWLPPDTKQPTTTGVAPRLRCRLSVSHTTLAQWTTMNSDKGCDGATR